MQDLNNLAYFAEVVDQGGFAAAGRKLGVPRSLLSRRIAELEAELGVRLLQRTTRKLSLTGAGETYYRHCVAVRDQAQAAQEAIAQVHAVPRGTVRMTCPVTVAQTTLAALLPRFLERYPEVRLEMEVTNRVVDLVDEGVDVALRVRTSLEDSGSLVIKRLGDTRGMLVASPRQLAREGTPARVEDLGRLATVAMSAQDGRTTWRLQHADGRIHDFQHRPRATASDLLVLRQLVVAGVGMSMLPDYLCRHDLQAGTLMRVLQDWQPQPAVLHAVFPSRRGMVPAVRALLDFLGENVVAEGQACPR